MKSFFNLLFFKHSFPVKFYLLTIAVMLFIPKKNYSQVQQQIINNQQPTLINIVYTSDVHYGITKKVFRGDSNVTSHVVNAAMIKQMNTLPELLLPEDRGVNAGQKIAAIDYVIESGDITNRMEIPNQTAAVSWAQFEKDYMHGLNLKGHNGKKTQLLFVPGNHDISNAIGYYKPMFPLTDPTAMVKIYNYMLKPKTPMTNETYDYTRDKINYSRNIEGVHLIFVNLWPDSAERIWMQKDLDTLTSNMPVIIFTHDQPAVDAVHFINPASTHEIKQGVKFENLTAEIYKDSIALNPIADKSTTAIEQREWVAFLKLHPNIKAYFHGHNNWTDFYTYTGPDHDVNLKVFRVDSPMKGKFSAQNETLLSFQLITIDPVKQELTVRECLWNTLPKKNNQQIAFGKNATISIKTR